MGEKCSTHGRDEKLIKCFGQNTGKEKYHLEDLGIDGGIILKRILKKLG
jgi:hypothetical protein